MLSQSDDLVTDDNLEPAESDWLGWLNPYKINDETLLAIEYTLIKNKSIIL